MNNSSNKALWLAIILTVVTGGYLIIDSFIIGRDAFFLLLNKDLGGVADLFFKFWTNLGDGAAWVVVSILVLLYRRNQWPLLFAAIIISTLITQLTKGYVIPAEPRPTAAIKGFPIHTVEGVEVHTAYSFPSGHTAAAFTIFLLGCILVRKKWVLPVGFAYALLVAYSRVYLAQHFPLDLGGGMITAVITILLSLAIQNAWDRRQQKKNVQV